MSQYQSMIDDALEKAKARLGKSVEHSKEASADGDAFTKEAGEVANALEYMSLALADDGTAAGEQRVAMVQDFFKQAGKSSGFVGHTETTTKGEQSQPPTGSKKKQPTGSLGGDKPEESESMTGKTPENILRQMPPNVAPTPPTPQVGEKKTAELSLYDMLMNNKEAADKTAAQGGPQEMDSEQAFAHTPTKAEGKAFADSLLGSNTAPVSATRRQAKAPTRPRLSEVWEHAGDTVGDATARAVWPGAHAKGDIKVAELARAFQKEAVTSEAQDTARNVARNMMAHGEKSKAAKDLFKRRAAKGAVAAGGAAATVGAGLGIKKLLGRKQKADKERAKNDPTWNMTSSEEKKYLADKKASLADYSELFDSALEGNLGEEAQQWAQSVEAA